MIALMSLLISFQSVVTFKRQFVDYQSKLSSTYAMVVIAKSVIKQHEITSLAPSIKDIKLVDKKEVISSIKEGLNKDDLKELYNELPLFYRVYFKKLPTKLEIIDIEKKIKKLPQVEEVEGFALAQNKILALLEMVKNILTVFSGLFLLISVILITKQIKVWEYMHANRIQIMSILGAKICFRSKPLFIMAIVSSLLSSLLSASLFFFLANSNWVLAMLRDVGLVPLRYYVFQDFFTLLGISLLISLFGVFYLVYKSEKEVV